nr:glycosyltransferase [uncultured Vibrio sp.]
MKPSTLYLSYTGLLEPLGRSQILSYLSRLSKEYSITLVTFEKIDDISNDFEVENLKAECLKFGIVWRPHLYHNRPRLLAKILDLIILFSDIVRLSSSSKVKVVHCRGYIPAIATWFSSKFTKKKYIFDMRALWVDEIIEGGRLKKNSIINLALRKLECAILRDASAVVSLTESAIPFLLDNYRDLERKKFSVIPTCVDLEKFDTFSKVNNGITFGTMGTVINARFRSDWLFKLFSAQKSRNSDTNFKIVSRDSIDEIEHLISEYDLTDSNFLLTSSRPQDIVTNISDIDVAVVLFTPGTSTLGTSPTRIGEFLACGIPVIVNSGVGDTASIIRENNVGVVLDNDADDSIESALNSISILLKDKSLAARCKKTAKSIFSVEIGVNKYRSIYQGLFNNG